MRITSIISSFANAIGRFDNAGVEMVRALLLGEPRFQSVQQTRLHTCAGFLVAYLLPGNPRTSVQSWLGDITAKPNGDLILANSSGAINAMPLPSDFDLAGTDRTYGFGLGLS